jgi:hypothetical protein
MSLFDWYCSEPRLAFNRIVVLRYRSHLESRQLPPAPSICVLLPSAGSHTKRPTALFSAPIWLPVFGFSLEIPQRARRGVNLSEFQFNLLRGPIQLRNAEAANLSGASLFRF